MSIPRLIPFAALTLVVGCATDPPLLDDNLDPAAPIADADITPAQRDSVLWKRYQELRRDDLVAHVATSDSLQEYAAKCAAATGLHVPAFSCDAGTEVPGQGTTPAGSSCTTPNVLNGHCDPGAKFQVLAQTADAAVVAHCRKVGLPIAGSQYNDIAIIQYNKANGAVCFYQALGGSEESPGPLDGSYVGAPADGTWSSWFSPAKTRNTGCVGCHDSGGFIRSPYLAQLRTGSQIMPSTAHGFDNLNTPLKFVGADFAGDRTWSVTAPAAPCPPGESCTPCGACHRLAVNNLSRHRGTAADFARKATAPTQRSKVPHSAASPIWMRPGQITYRAEAEQSAINYENCAKGFFDSGFSGAPAGCTITPLGTAYYPNLDPFTGGDDIAVLGSSAAGAQLTVAFFNSDGSIGVTNTTGGDFSAWARTPGVKRLSGDFNKDGFTDFALVGGPGWNTMPVAMSNGNYGTFTVTNASVGPDFNNWVRTAGVSALVGDYNKDGYSDIALTGGSGWASIPVAFSAGGGTWQVTNFGASYFGGLASHAQAKPLVGDFNKDGYSDIALVGPGYWASVAVAFAAGGGTWQVTNQPAPSFNGWASTANVTPLVGDYNKDGYSDIALTGAAGWNTIPIAFSAGGGNWQITNSYASYFGNLASTSGVKPLTGDFNKDGYTDIALTGGSNWQSIPIAFSAGGGSWQITNGAAPSFGPWASTPGARALAGDFNGDGYTDVALTGGSGWASIPVALSTGGGNFDVTNRSVTFFPAAASDTSATLFVGRIRSVF